MNKKISFLIGAAMIGSFFILPSKVRAASECTDYGFKTWGNLIYNNYFFDDYERVEYINNLLRIHLKLKTPQNDSRPWILNYSILDDNCKNFFIKNEVRWLFLDPGIEYFSIRFITPTHYEIWNDELDVRQDCVYCSGDVPVVGDYNELFFQGSTYESVSFIRTSPYRIKGDATGPPIRNFSLAKPIACPEFFSNGDFFDNYERSEYENGYLKLYFRFNSLYDDGRGWFPRLFLYDEDCVLKKTFDPPDPYSAWIKRWTRYFSVRFTSPTHYEIWNDETNQKEECSLCSQDFSNLLPDGSEASYVSFFGLTSFPNSAVVSTPQPIEKAPALVDPVIIIPGILGSTQVYSTWYMDRILHTYDNLIETLAENGYEKEKNLFTFPYDWHESNIITAEKLRQKINKVQEVCRCEKVDLVAHSMGGLVARQYVQSDEYENDVDQLIFLGTPHLGAPNDYLMWEGGETDINFRNQLLKYYLIREAEKAGYDNLYEYIHKKPILSIKELLPVYAYIRDKNSEYLNDYPYDYPRNIFLENLDNTRFKLESRVRVANFQGLKITDDTITLIRVVSSKALPKWEYGYPEGFYEKIGDRGLERGQGDGTVPNNSAGRITENLNVIISEHGELPTKAEGLVFKELTGRDAEKLFIGSDTGWRIIIFKMLSPADMLVVSPDGKKIGRNFSTNEEVNEIEGAFYTGFLTDDEYITIPNPLDGEYKVYTKGTDNGGSYTVLSAYISDDAFVEKEFSAETLPEQEEELLVNVDNLHPENLQILPADNEPPQIEINLPPDKKYLHSDYLKVNIFDLESGVASSTIKFDGKIISGTSSIDLFYEKLGEHRLYVSAVDFLGNPTSTNIDFLVTAKIESTISDVKRSAELGWFGARFPLKNSLIRLLMSADKSNHEIARKALLNTALKHLDVAKRINQIDLRAYNILRDDIKWLINN